MTKIYCFSGSGHSLAVARAMAELLECDITEIGVDSSDSSSAEVAVIVFPVYCQNIPSPVMRFLETFRAKHIVLIATYGKISFGNVLYEAQQIVHGEIIAGAYIPMGHTFLDGDCTFDAGSLLPIIDRINTPKKVKLPKTRKNLLSNIFPALRSRIGVKLVKTNRCNSCGLCEKLCPTGAMQNGRSRTGCIRCLRCVTNCPQKALRYKNRWILEQYLKRHYKEEYVLYL